MKIAFKIIFVGLLAWSTVIIATRGRIGFLDNVDLIFHEAGHTIFHFFGDFIRILGGSLMQVLIPIICGVVFFFKKQWFAIGFAIWWLGQNLVNVSIYIGDATAQQLELLGGEAVIHDWNWLLGMMGKRHLDKTIASNVWWLGMIFMVLAILYSLYIIWRLRQEPATTNDI